MRATERQVWPSRHRATGKGGRRRKWSQGVNRIVMKCYYSRVPEIVRYLERMHVIWGKNEGLV